LLYRAWPQGSPGYFISGRCSLGKISQVAPIDKLSVALAIVFSIAFLGETLTLKTAIGCNLYYSGNNYYHTLENQNFYRMNSFQSHKKLKMDTITMILIIGIFAGMFSGFIGIGGGLIVVPCLVYFLGMSQHTAQGTSLAMMLPPIGAIAVYNYYKAGVVDF